MSILVPQIEASLRTLLGLLAGVTDQRKDGVFRRKELGKVLHYEVMKQFFSELGDKNPRSRWVVRNAG